MLRVKLGIFGSALGVAFLALAALSPGRTAESGQPVLEKPTTFSGSSYTVQGRMFLGADGNLSYLRFLNLSGASTIVTATMVGSPSGKNYGTATVNIANHASRQLSIADLMDLAKIPGLDSTDERMGVYLRADASPVAVQNVLFAGATGFFENMTTCQNSSVSDTNAALMNVHTTSITGFPSYVTIYNYSSNEQAYDVGVFEANTGAFKGQVTVSVPANGTFEQPFSWFQDQIAWSPGPSEYHANLTATARADSRSSQLSHTVYNAKLNVFLNLTNFCNIESTAGSLPTAVNDTLSNATAGLAYSIPSATLLSNDLNATGASITDVTTPTTNGSANGGIIQTGNELVYVPARAGIATFQYRLRVGTVASNAATVTVTVADNGPIAEGDRLVSLNFTTGLPTTIPLAALTVNDRNTANTRLVNVTSPMTTGTVNGTLTLTSDGLVYTAARPGTVTFRYQLQSSAGTLSNEALVSLTVTGSSGPTTIADQLNLNLVAGQATEIPIRLITANDFNTDGATLDNFTNPTTDGIVNGTLTRSGDNLVFTPARAGTAVFTYQLRNTQGLSNTGTVTMTVLSATAAPQAENDILTQAFTTGTQTTILFSNLIANDRGISGAVLDSFTAPSTDGTANGTVTRIGNDLAYTPARAGVVTFTYTLRTLNGTSNAATVRLIVQ